MSHAIDIDNKIDDDNYNSQCWKDIEAETGHKTYLSHLKNLPKRRPQLDRLASTLREADDPDTSIGGVQVLILDLLQDGNISTSLKIQCIGNEADQEYFVRKSSTQILENLRSPPESVPARIVLWLLQREVNPPPQIVDAVGLGLNLHPSILESVLQFVKLSTRERKPDGLNCVTIGDRVATIVRDYRPQGYSPPVLLIGGLFDFNYSSYIIPRGLNSTYDEFVRDTLEEEMGGDTSFGPFSAIDEVPGDRLTVLSLNYWLKLLDSCDQNDRSADLQGTNRLLTYMMQLIHIEILRLRIQCDCLQWQIRGVRFLTELQEFVLDDIREKNYRWLDEHRFWLRRRLEGLRESRDRFVRFTRSQGGTEWLKETEWLSLNEDVTEAIAHARLYDTEARDVMQHMTANLSIIESRKSIHVSNRQMDEAKRVKILTILAFIYVPLNLATSIFGMNLQPLNQTGQNITSLIVTAVVALLVTGLVWMALVQYNHVREWERKRVEKLSQADREQEQIVRKRRGDIAVRGAIKLGLVGVDDLEDYTVEEPRDRNLLV